MDGWISKQPYVSRTKRNKVVPEAEGREVFSAQRLISSLARPAAEHAQARSTAMAITILAPAPAIPYLKDEDSDEDSDDGGVDVEGDAEMRPAKRAKHASAKDIVTPGELLTDDSQWMRYVARRLGGF